MLDTPGFGVFIQEARGASGFADAAAVVVDAVSGSDGANREGLALCRGVWGSPALLWSNRMDRDTGKFRIRSLESIQQLLGPNVRAHPDSHRRRKKIQGRCRPRYDEGIHVDRGWQRKIH